MFDPLTFAQIAQPVTLIFLLSIFLILIRQQSQKRQESSYLQAFLDLQRKQHDHVGQLSQRLDLKLDRGLGETNKFYTSLVKRLAMIEQTQQNLSEMSQQIVDLESVLKHPQGRGHFGESQLSHLIDNILPPTHREYQYSLPNGKRADCIIKMPSKPALLAIDAKFPLANFSTEPAPETTKLFKQDLKLHINVIAEKYIIPDITQDYAIMFVPAEGIYHQIHHQHPEMILYAQKKKVWLASPTTLTALLHISMNMIKDIKMQKHMSEMKNQLQQLEHLFELFQKRTNQLNKHFQSCQQDVTDIHNSASKICRHFNKISQIETDEKSHV